MRWCWMWSEGYSFSCFPGDIMFWALAWFSLDLVMFLLFFLFIKIITLCFYWQLRWWWHHINLSCGNISVSGGCGRRKETREGVGRVGLKTTYEKNRVPRISSCSEPLLGFPSKLGHDTWTISSLFSYSLCLNSLVPGMNSLSYLCVTGFSVFHLPVLATTHLS